MCRIPGLVMRYIGLVLLAVRLYTLFCLLGGYACGLGIFLSGTDKSVVSSMITRVVIVSFMMLIELRVKHLFWLA